MASRIDNCLLFKEFGSNVYETTVAVVSEGSEESKRMDRLGPFRAR